VAAITAGERIPGSRAAGSATCAFCVDEQSLADGLHPQVPFTPVWADSTRRLFGDLTAEGSGFSLFARRRQVATLPELEPGRLWTVSGIRMTPYSGAHGTLYGRGHEQDR
jgi:hypothetical protein